MRLTRDDAWARLDAHDHGVLGTVHAERGVDAVPVVYATHAGRWVGVPVDRVKPKAATPLQRERNLGADPRATLLVEHWDPADWDRLWWVRANLVWRPAPTADAVDALTEGLVARYPQYAGAPFLRVLALEVVEVSGWAASAASAASVASATSPPDATAPNA